MAFLKLHYELNNERRYYKGRLISIKRTEKVSEDYVGRESRLDFSSHVGTHIDFPAHFIKDGKFGNEYPFDYLFSSNVSILCADMLSEDIPVLRADNLDLSAADRNTEILIIKTGFCDIRDEERYWAQSPVIDSELPLELKKYFPSLKSACFDIISVKSLLDGDEGVKCHINFLSSKSGKEVLIIEDSDLRRVDKVTKIKFIKIVPLLFEQMEGSPCSIIAEV